MLVPFSEIEDAIKDLQQGKMIILVDDESRENEGDLVVAAEKITPETVNFMATHGRGLICLSMHESLIDRLKLPMMVSHNQSSFKTAFTVSIEARDGVSTGISAHDRATTILAAIDSDAKPEDLVSPGHIFPLRARPNGVFERRGQTEGSVDLVRLAGLKPAAAICEVVNDDGSMARRTDLSEFGKKHDIKVVSIEDLIRYRLKNEVLVDELASSPLPIKGLGEFTIKVFGNRCDLLQHIALVKEPMGDTPLTRIHSECLTGDVFGSARCDCGSQLEASLERLSKEGGVLIYMRQEGRGIGLVNKIKAYALQQEHGLDTVEANNHLGLPIDGRDYAFSAQILKQLGVERIRLLTNNPQKVEGLRKYGVDVVSREPLVTLPTDENHYYLRTKKEKLGHIFAQLEGGSR